MAATHYDDAEQAVLGACLSIEYATAYPDAAGIITADDWWRPAHATLWDVFGDLYAAGTPLDPVLVLAELERQGVAGKVGGAVYLATLYQAAVPNVQHHARLVADAATRRRVLQAGQRIAQRAETGDVDPAELVQWAGDQLAAARDDRAGVDVLTTPWADFIHSTPDERVMVIPGLLGEGDRIVLTGSGGLGKSTMLQQIAVCAAAGLPPFDWQTEDPFEPVRVTIMDGENPDHRLKTRLWPMVQACREFGLDPRPQLTLGGHGNSIDLLNPQTALSMLRTIEHDKPDLLYIGPVYKLHNDDPDKEVVVKKITGVLDAIRAMGVSLITEAHHTKAGGKNMASLEPSGSNLWTWWPEFGLGLRLVADSDDHVRRCTLERWRIDREESSWPHDVQSSGRPGLPWARAAALPPEYPEAGRRAAF